MPDYEPGSALKILLCTEAASEGLNLQTCGVLINYDMPWNPMRVEQRIGRIDRIGQRYERVWVRNYFYEETVEAQVYQALSHRIDWFQDVVGPLQPILARVGQVIQSLALVPQVERQAAFAQEVQRLQADLDQAQAGLNLDEWVCSQARSEAECRSRDGTPFHSVPDYEPAAPVTLPELAHVLTTSTALGHRFRPHERLPGAFWLRREGGEVAVTFDPACYDAHPDTLQLLTYGNPLLTELLAVCSELVCSQARSEAKCRSRDGTPLRSVPDYKPDYEPVLRLHTEDPLPCGWLTTPGTSRASRVA